MRLEFGSLPTGSGALMSKSTAGARLLPRSLVLLGCLLVAGFVHAEGTLVRHAQGVAEVEAVPQRVATFDIGALDTLDALGVEVAGVPKGSLPDRLLRYAGEGYADVGTLFIPDRDALQALDADLIILGRRSGPAYADLADIAPVLDLAARADNFTADVVNTTLSLGRIFGKDAEASALAARLLETRAELARRLAGQDTALSLMAVGGRLVPHAHGERHGNVYDLLAMRPILPPRLGVEGEARPERGSPEALASQAEAERRLAEALGADPDWLLVLDRPSATGGESEAAAILAADPRIAATRAAHNGRIVFVDSREWYIATGGIRGVQDTLEQVLELLPAERAAN